MVDGVEMAAFGGEVQTSDATTLSALFLIADGAHPHGLLVQSHAGRYKEVGAAFIETWKSVYPEGMRPTDDATLANLKERVAAKQ